jgi:uncharacterized protein
MRIPHNEPLGSATSGAPERRCILTGDHGSRDALLRLAVSPDGDVLPDAQAKAPGRGAWIAVDRAALETAVAKGKLKGALARAFKGASLTIPDDLPDRIEAALRKALTDRLGLAKKAGTLLTGSDRIGEQARMGKVAWLAHAADASADGSRKLDQAWRVGRGEEGSGLAGVTLPLDRAALSVALGRDNVVHLALTDAAAAQRVDAAAQRLLHFLGLAEGQGQSTGEPDEAASAAPVATTH